MADVSRRPSLAVRIFGWVFIIVLVIAFVEFTAFGYYFAKDGRVLSAHARLLDETNKFTAEILDPSKCTYIDTLYPHPYLAFVHTRGNQILAKVIAQHLSEAWGLERTCPAS